MYEHHELREGIVEIFHDAQTCLRERYFGQAAIVAAETRARAAERNRALTEEVRVLRRLRGAPKPIEPLPRPFACATCGERFGSAHGRHCHAFRVHGVSQWDGP
jgi:hypothetical protein